MDISTYQTLSGITVLDSQLARVTAAIARTQAILETMLGYSLDPVIALQNQYNESGISSVECDDDSALDPADPVETAYRIFPYNRHDKYLNIDPATSINKVKLIRNNITVLVIDDYRVDYKNGLIKYLRQEKCFYRCYDECHNVQLAVDAVWLGGDDYQLQDLPDDLLFVWSDMITFYADAKRNIRSETLATHSYTKFTNQPPEMLSHNMAVLNKYVGPNGSLNKTLTI
jgi:hypothetical protein